MIYAYLVVWFSGQVHEWICGDGDGEIHQCRSICVCLFIGICGCSTYQMRQFISTLVKITAFGIKGAVVI